MKIKTCRDQGSNQGPSDLQSDALPTELSRLGEKEDANIEKILPFSKLLCLLSKEALKHISHYLENFFEKEYLFG